MPTYEYACMSCGTHVEVYQRFSEDALTVCAVCGGTLRKVFHPAGILFKGSGFYATDSRAAASKSAAANGEKGESSSGEKVGTKSGPGSKSESSDGSKAAGSSDGSGSKSGSSDGSKNERSSPKDASARRAKEKSA